MGRGGGGEGGGAVRYGGGGRGGAVGLASFSDILAIVGSINVSSNGGIGELFSHNIEVNNGCC